jgi:hypothetical protein
MLPCAHRKPHLHCVRKLSVDLSHGFFMKPLSAFIRIFAANVFTE